MARATLNGKLLGGRVWNGRTFRAALGGVPYETDEDFEVQQTNNVHNKLCDSLWGLADRMFRNGMLRMDQLSQCKTHICDALMKQFSRKSSQ